MNIVVFHSSSCCLMYLHVLQSCLLLLSTPFLRSVPTVRTLIVCFILNGWFLKLVTKNSFLWHSSFHFACQCCFFCNISATLLFYFRNISSQKSSITEDGKIDGSPTTNISCNDFTAEAKPSVSVVSPMCIKSISSSLAPRQHGKPDRGVVYPVILLLDYHETYPKEIWAKAI